MFRIRCREGTGPATDGGRLIAEDGSNERAVFTSTLKKPAHFLPPFFREKMKLDTSIMW